MNRFDQLAATWDSNPGRIAVTTAIAAAMRQAVPFSPTWRLLDYGAGTGLLTLSLVPEVHEAVAVDTSAGMLEVLAAKASAAGLSRVTVCQADLQVGPWTGEPVDAAVSAMTLHHLRDVPLVLRRLAGAVRSGGWLAVADLDTEDGSFHGAGRDDVFHLGFERAEVAGWLTDAGLGEVAVHDAVSFPKPDAVGRVREYSVFVAVGRKP